MTEQMTMPMAVGSPALPLPMRSAAGAPASSAFGSLKSLLGAAGLDACDELLDMAGRLYLFYFR